MLGNTPMMIQYEKVKAEHQDCILFYRLGDFYEMFGPDAEVASKILGIALTGRDGGMGKVPMCGVPFHSADNYIAKLIEVGKKVAICEQMEDPKSVKGLVKREVIRIISPGTILESSFLKEKDNNYLISIARDGGRYGLAIVDASTGEFLATEIAEWETLTNEIWRYDPVECIISIEDQELKEQLQKMIGERPLVVNEHLDYAFEPEFCSNKLLEHFNINSLLSLGCEEKPLLQIAAGAVLDYLTIMQKTRPSNITSLKVYSLDETMHLDYATKRNLELIKSLHTNEKKDALLGVIDYTRTALGSRLLKNWLEKPLIKEADIQERLDATEEIVDDTALRASCKAHLEPIYDLERIVSRISYGTANAKDMLALRNSLALLPDIGQDLANGQSTLFQRLAKDFDALPDVYELLVQSIAEEAPFSLREGNLIKDGYNEQVDELRDVLNNGKRWIVELELREKERTGIKSLKVSFNKVFGYYIDITKSNLANVPEDYIRKQTLANSERFVTPELKELESKVLGADERLRELEYQLFVQVRTTVAQFVPRILETAHIIAQLDCINSLAHCAIYNNFHKPIIAKDGVYHIEECRHPIVERKLKNGWFVPNDVHFDPVEQRFLIITGPNMAGKSTYCRSVAVASILMQIGSFVPAKSASMPIVDRVFARIGASDDLNTGQSTFMVEMNEVANIVNNATKDSLIILDEVGRGTSTYDGLSIAWALTDYINQHIQAKTLFATHYHELTVLEEQQGIKNYSVAVKEDGEDIVFLRKILPGGADRSYGIHVAKLAGMPEIILRNANTILEELERDKEDQHDHLVAAQLAQAEEVPKPANRVREQPMDNLFGTPVQSAVVQELAKINLLSTTPLEALNLLFELQNKAKQELSF